MNNKNKISQILLCILAALTLLNSVMIFTVLLKVQNLQNSPPVVINEVGVSQAEKTTEYKESKISDETTKSKEVDVSVHKEEAETSEKNTEKEMEKSTEKTEEDDNSPYCYVTASGTKYHREGCSYLKKSKTKLTVNQAKSSGYAPCSRCY